MQGLDRQLCEFVPRGRLEAFSWYWACGDYSFIDALALRPLEVCPDQIRRCRKVRLARLGRPVEEYVVDFTQTRHNRIVAASLPGGFPKRLVESGSSRRYLLELIAEGTRCLPLSLTAWWVLASLFAVSAIQLAVPLYAHAFLLPPTPECGLACAERMARLNAASLAALAPALAGFLIPLRARSVLARPGLSPVLRALTRMEIFMLPCLGAATLPLVLRSPILREALGL